MNTNRFAHAGKQMYFGEMHEVRSYMESYGCEALEEIGTAEHILDCITRTAIEDESAADVEARMKLLADRASSADVDLGLKASASGPGKHIRHFHTGRKGGPAANILTQFWLLLKRSFKEVTRAKTSIVIKSVQQITLALIYGGIYSLGSDQASIQDRFGLFSLIAIGASNVSVSSRFQKAELIGLLSF